MGILNKFLGSKPKQPDEPNNEKLIHLINKYKKNNSSKNYRSVYNELVSGNSYLLVPSDNSGLVSEKWETVKDNRGLLVTSIYNLDGLKAIGVFTSEETLLKWAEKETEYTALNANDVLDLCKREGFDRVVIDSDMPTMFVLERNTENVRTETIQKETTVKVGTPLNPITGELLKKFQTNFSKVTSIEEVYHYLMIRNDESILILGFRLSSYSENATKASINAVQNAMLGETLELPLDLFMLEDDEWYRTAKNVSNSLIYIK